MLRARHSPQGTAAAAAAATSLDEAGGGCASCASLPNLHVRFHISHRVLLSGERAQTPESALGLLWRWARSSTASCGCRRRAVPPKAAVLDAVAGEIRGGEPVLLLSAPDGGASCFLRSLTGRLALQPGSSLTLGGAALPALHAAGVDVRRLACFVGAGEALEPLLTVRETLEFVEALCAPGRGGGCG